VGFIDKRKSQEVALRPETLDACPTMRAADGGYAPRFQAFFAALSLPRFEGESTLPLTAANASR
jgi:hypothetical protein